jgi:hypothetical protein
MIKFISTPNKEPFITESDFPETTVEISAESIVTPEQLGNMLLDFARAIGFHESLVERFSSEYNPCEGCEIVAELREKEKEEFANSVKDDKLVWVPDPDGEDSSSSDCIEGESV